LTTPAILALDDGALFQGLSVGAEGSTVGEVVFNTAMTGYQEILTDPSYARQLVTLTYPHIGNTGINVHDVESAATHVAGLIVRDVPRLHSNWRSNQSLTSYLRERQVVAIADIDTRRLTRHLRRSGARGGCIVSGGALDTDQAVAAAKAFPGLAGMDLAKEVSCQAPWRWSGGSGAWGCTYNSDLSGVSDNASSRSLTSSTAHARRFHVVAMDFGIKFNSLRRLAWLGCDLTVVPAQTTVADIVALTPDGVFLSNGPGDPEPCGYAITTIQALLARRLPLFGVCLGHQLLALAAGAKTFKMKFGHHGANHPVQDLRTGHVMISSQNHGFAVERESLGGQLEATHLSLFDGSLQGIRHTEAPAFGFQGHPEAGPGPHDCIALFDDFITLMSTATVNH